MKNQITNYQALLIATNTIHERWQVAEWTIIHPSYRPFIPNHCSLTRVPPSWPEIVLSSWRKKNWRRRIWWRVGKSHKMFKKKNNKKNVMKTRWRNFKKNWKRGLLNLYQSIWINYKKTTTLPPQKKTPKNQQQKKQHAHAHTQKPKTKTKEKKKALKNL